MSYLGSYKGWNICILCLVALQLCSFDCFLVQNHCPKALDSTPNKYTSMTDSAVLSGIGTTIIYEVNKSIQVRAYLFPELVVGSLPIVSMAIQMKGSLGISKCN